MDNKLTVIELLDWLRGKNEKKSSVLLRYIYYLEGFVEMTSGFSYDSTMCRQEFEETLRDK